MRVATRVDGARYAAAAACRFDCCHAAAFVTLPPAVAIDAAEHIDAAAAFAAACYAALPPLLPAPCRFYDALPNAGSCCQPLLMPLIAYVYATFSYYVMLSC